jgi:hypothetical protein
VSMSGLIAPVVSMLGGGAIVRFIDWRRTRDERQQVRDAQRENLAIQLLRDQVFTCMTEIGRLRVDLEKLRDEKHSIARQCTAALLAVVALKSEVNEVLIGHGEPARYDLRHDHGLDDVAPDPQHPRTPADGPEGHTLDHP